MTAPLWTRDSAAEATGGTPTIEDWQASGVSIDSRQIAPGDLFIALAGPRFDGHDHAGEALANGAVAAVVSRAVEAPGPQLLVPDTREALGGLAKAARARTGARVIAVTGSVGKTGTKELLRAGLSALGPTHASGGNLNNHLGAPLSLARMPAQSAFGVFELGMNHAGEIRPLARLVRPDVALITAIEAVHLENFNSVEGIADAKAEILEGLAPGGIAILPADNPHFARLSAAARKLDVEIMPFGASESASARLLSSNADPEGQTVTAEIAGERLSWRLALSGRHWAMNAVAALAGIAALGGDAARAAAGMGALSPIAGRGARLELPWPGGSLTVIDESYNASPASVRATAEMFAGLPADRRIMVLGDMLELGPEGPRMHADLAGTITAAGIDKLYCCGPLMRHLHDALPDRLRGGWAQDCGALAALLPDVLHAGDAVLIKGSLGSGMRRAIDALIARAKERATIDAV